VRATVIDAEKIKFYTLEAGEPRRAPIGDAMFPGFYT
jgi:hypothetical protein